jgi:hypothetical protein
MDANAAARRAWVRVGRSAAAAPGTHILLLILVVTTLLLVGLDQVTATRVLRAGSTNLVEMARDAPRVLFLSAFLLGPGNVVADLARVAIVFIPLERWLGTWRWLATFAAGHVGATMATTVGIWWQVRHGTASSAELYPVDVGVSYALFAGAGALVSWFRRPVAIALAAALAAVVTVGVVRSGTFTDWGHAAALAIGLTLGPVLRPQHAQPPLVRYARWLAHEPDPASDRHRRRVAIVVGAGLLVAAGAFTREAFATSHSASSAVPAELVTARVVGRPADCGRGCSKVVVQYRQAGVVKRSTIQLPPRTFARRGDALKMSVDPQGIEPPELQSSAGRIDVTGLFGAAAVTAAASALLVLVLTLRRTRREPAVA